ncbi:MAG: phycobilisome linker polypeptide [Synechococcus sp. SB0678_bin_12]|nr:phycobilisome linker polypeptide [Synechococcus sp. SB0678_bin_12]MYI88682.1 phycobilisome linker polypeptide [Synechococcus sp. SB0672_bin_10]
MSSLISLSDQRTQKYSFGVARDLDQDPIRLSASRDNLDAVINSAYRQVFGGIGLFDVDRVSIAESQLRQGNLSVKGFIEALGQSSAYERLFLSATSPHRFVELNCKHFLGRPPANEAEVSTHVKLLREQGYAAEISSYVNSDEYQQVFGDETVPYLRSINSLVGFAQDTFNKTFRLRGGAAASDFSMGRSSRTIAELLGYPNYAIPLPSQGRPLPKLSNFARVTRGPQSVPLSSSPYGGFGVGERVQPRYVRQAKDNATDKATLLRQLYRHAMGNPHLMETERPHALESQFLSGRLSVREFVRGLCKTPLYRSRFFETMAPYRFVEVNYKHVLGRSPESQAEMGAQLDRVITAGYDAAIDWLVDSDEYSNAFGEDMVPCLRGVSSGDGRSQANFNRTLALVPGYAGSDSIGSNSSTVDTIAGASSLAIATRSTASSGSGDAPSKRFRIVVRSQRAGSRRRLATTTYVVSGDNITSQLAFIHRDSGRIVSLTEIS